MTAPRAAGAAALVWCTQSPATAEITSADDGAGGGYKHDRRVIIYPSYNPVLRRRGWRIPKTPPATPQRARD